MKLLTLSCAVVFALLLAGPLHDCTGVETGAEHAEQCQGCLFAASSAVFEKSSPTLPEYDFVGAVPCAPEPGYPRLRDTQPPNRAPPQSLA